MPTPNTPPSPTQAITGLRAFATRVSEIRATGTRAEKRLHTYALRAQGLISTDAQRRYRELTSLSSSALLAGEFVPSLVELAQVNIVKETRFSLLLAALLDPARCGRLSERFWARFLSLIQAHARPQQQEQVRSAVALWTPEMRRRVQVTPTQHASEWHNLDVFARVATEHSYACGLVIENKVNVGTEEQDEQLDRYWERVGQLDTHAQDNTLFVFLTEGPRVMKTAKRSRTAWVQLTWSELEQLLWEIAEEQDLALGHRLLALQVRDLVRKQVLGLSTLGAERQALQALHAALEGLDGDHPAWREKHGAIASVWSRTQGALDEAR